VPIQLNEENNGKLLVIHVSGKLVKEGYAAFVHGFDRLVQQHGMAAFAKPFTKAQVRYFDRANAAEAREWLDEA
jgi:hypothetical protein